MQIPLNWICIFVWTDHFHLIICNKIYSAFTIVNFEISIRRSFANALKIFSFYFFHIHLKARSFYLLLILIKLISCYRPERGNKQKR